jgi:thioesterase domain-containing protein
MDAKSVEQMLHQLVPLIKIMNISVTKFEPENVELRLDENKDNYNHFGKFYAGALFTLGEVTGGVAMLSRDALRAHLIVARAASIKYLKPIGKTAVATAALPDADAEILLKDLEETGRASKTLPVAIKNADDEIAVEMSVEYYLKKS